ncbi:hypothetical protein N5D61_21805 [Pseudomonas sp. GD03842]|uniref:hypothetical protein n=1 Tax=unclassified Pseudomonas TaxID=196821 RepID=UPI000D3D9AB4|nr:MULTISPECIES: hypothetical protein [unclassified Pseudomonas]MDH0748968.1 hypothetical protein [Pseudomonas sp. GD03842]RAU39462.1 hypothetical protein DBP26_026250 [Pseudomonas sp. RIT 409]RAU50699.1 hypothetical protein DBY65_021975 [Pseudomonas sp. RIT 412]
MNFAVVDRSKPSLMLLAISLFSVVVNFLWQGHTGFNLWDEGYLWYGAKEIAAGAVPIRDFMAYDPGRYYWAASYFWLSGDTGISALRVSVALFQVLGMYAGLWTISLALRGRSFTSTLIYLSLAAITLMTWMYPRHKIFDISISMIIIAAIAHLVLSPTSIRYFLLGVIVGLAAVFGRNHGVYGALASAFALGWLSIARKPDNFRKAILLWGTGVFVGFLPVILMCAIIPGYLKSFLDTIVFMLDQGNTNLPLPVPWPWTVGFGTAGVEVETRWLLIGLCFMALIGFGVGSLVWIFRAGSQRKAVPPEWVAVACAALPYSHYAFARADLGHLAQAIYPLLVGVLIALAASEKIWIRVSLAALTAMVSVFILAGWQPGILARTQAGWKTINVSGTALLVDPSTSEAVELLRDLTHRYSPDGRPVLVLPFWPGAYPLLNRKAPLWEIYALSPRSEEFQRNEIEEIKKANPGFALVFDMAMDGREELRYSNSHRLIDEYIRANFERIQDSPNAAYLIYKAKAANPLPGQ